MSADFFPPLGDWEATHQALHAYSKVVGVVPRAHANFHPKWWHISLKVAPNGLVTENMSIPGGGIFNLRMDMRAHHVALTTSDGNVQTFSMTEGLSANALAESLFGAVADLGLSADYAREKFESDDPHTYDPAAAERFFTALVNVDRTLKQHRVSLSGEMGPVQLWPHGFDIAFEWFGTRVVEYEENGEVQQYPSQINFGFSPGESTNSFPYFYSNPWPFETDQLLDKPLPAPGAWFTENFQGSMLKYADLAGDPQAESKLLAYLKAVFDHAGPTLTA